MTLVQIVCPILVNDTSADYIPAIVLFLFLSLAYYHTLEFRNSACKF